MAATNGQIQKNYHGTRAPGQGFGGCDRDPKLHSHKTMCGLWDDSLTHLVITWNISSYLNDSEYLNIKKKKAD